MSAHWTELYLGLPYEEGGQGPQAFDCWGFFRHVQRAEFGRDLQPVVSAEGLLRIARTLGEESAARHGWMPTSAPRSGDGVWMAHLTHPTHVGIFVDDVAGGAVLHCVSGAGSVLHSRTHLEIARWRIAGFYRYGGAV
jgi:cell wall-associated NlpC family hydrolase